MILPIIIFITPLIGYAIFFYLIIKNARRSAKRWREEIRKEIDKVSEETLPGLKSAIDELKAARER